MEIISGHNRLQAAFCVGLLEGMSCPLTTRTLQQTRVIIFTSTKYHPQINMIVQNFLQRGLMTTAPTSFEQQYRWNDKKSGANVPARFIRNNDGIPPENDKLRMMYQFGKLCVTRRNVSQRSLITCFARTFPGRYNAKHMPVIVNNLILRGFIRKHHNFLVPNPDMQKGLVALGACYGPVLRRDRPPQSKRGCLPSGLQGTTSPRYRQARGPCTSGGFLRS